jgi:hypothetical protein
MAVPNEDEDDRIEAKCGDRDHAAVFHLSNGYLQSGDWYMGRHIVEPRALIPMRVYWVNEREAVQQFQNTGTQDEPKLQTNGSSQIC